MDPEPPIVEPVLAEEQPPTFPTKKRFSLFARLPRNRLFLTSAIALLVLGLAVGVGLGYHNQKSKPTGCEGGSCNTNQAVSPTGSATPIPTATPTPVARLLDGVLVPPGEENIRPLGVMIENHPDARPQSGLGSANWVYEAIAEGGITRFLALFANPDTEDIKIGPIRSVRTYYLDFAREYNAFLAHVGGNIDALDSIKANGGITDLDQFGIGEPTYKRDFSRNVPTEHTMYSTTAKLWSYITSKGYDRVGGYQPLLFTDELPVAQRGTAQTVSINFSSASFAVTWIYDPSTNSYNRGLAGVPHKDANTNQAITAKNIVLETVARQFTNSRDGKEISKMTLTGSGKVVVINNGLATVGTWKRSGNERTRYYATDGTELKLTRGTTWVEVVHSDTPVSY